MFRELASVAADSMELQRQRDKIVERCLPLADHIARRFEGRGEPRDDLVQVARVGLVNAVVRFDVDAGSDFVSFAVPTIMGEVRRHFRDNSWSVKVPRRLKELHLRLGTATADLSQRLGRAPTATELAAELEMDREEVVEGLVAGSSYNTLSIDSGGGGEEEEARAIADTLGDVDTGLDRIEDQESLRPLLEALPERERTVLVLRFFESMTQTQIAERVGISQMHVSRLLAKIANAAAGPIAVAAGVFALVDPQRLEQRLGLRRGHWKRAVRIADAQQPRHRRARRHGPRHLRGRAHHVDPVQGRKARGANELQAAQVEDHPPGAVDALLDVRGELIRVGRVELTLDRDQGARRAPPGGELRRAALLPRLRHRHC